MSVAGGRPAHGLRLRLERAGAGEPLRYEGVASTAQRDFALQITVEASGAVAVTTEEGAPADLAEKARLIVRAALRHAQAEGLGPPRRIQRWRGEK